EEAFRDVKSERFGLGFAAGRSAQQARWAVLLLIANLAMFVLRCVGTACKNIKAESRFQSNTRRTRAVLSVISLGLQSIRCHAVSFTRREMRAAFDQVLYQGIL
ncbi:MAG: hypothetical protein OEW08_11580, partial [Gammaproteobacteria bacterium]|nr:hypothetical protein [Gammaproteobacteria bacterium]